MGKKLRVLVITLGGDRRQKIEDMFSDPAMAEHFEPPVFSEGVSSRYIRSRFNFFKVANDAGLLPEKEWEAVLECTNDDRYYGQPTERFFDCLGEVPVTKDRHGAAKDIKLHYSVELWQKAKGINRGRSVLACVFAHLIAMKRFVRDGDFDLILEDNVRTDPRSCAKRVRESCRATREWEESTEAAETGTETATVETISENKNNKDSNNNNSSNNNHPKCHFRFVGWLGSIPNVNWILNTHMPKRKYVRKNKTGNDPNNAADDNPTICPLPRLEHLDEDLASIVQEGVAGISIGENDTDTGTDTGGGIGGSSDKSENENETKAGTTPLQEAKADAIDDESEEEEEAESPSASSSKDGHHQKPGGNLLWGAYAYWISKEAYESLIATLRSDVGAMLWRGKRMRNYAVKPIDKILPRQTLKRFGPGAVHITSHPAFFRAPMLTSKIHTKWDPGFCESTDYQLEETKLSWTDLWLTDTEREIVNHHTSTGKWLTVSELKSLRSE